MYDRNTMDNWLELEKHIINGNKVRRKWRPTIMKLSNLTEDVGCYLKCGVCGAELFARFGDYSKGIDNKFVACPNNTSDEPHGAFASVINLILN